MGYRPRTKNRRELEESLLHINITMLERWHTMWEREWPDKLHGKGLFQGVVYRYGDPKWHEQKRKAL